MGSVHQIAFKGNGDEAEVAMTDLVRALRRAVAAQAGTEATFGEREATALEAANEASRRY